MGRAKVHVVLSYATEKFDLSISFEGYVPGEGLIYWFKMSNSFLAVLPTVLFELA